MSKRNRTELLLEVWVKLDEIKNLTSAVIKGLDYEIKMEMEEMRSVLNVVNKLTEEVINDINENIV